MNFKSPLLISMGTYQIEIHDCDNFETRSLYEAELKRAGAEVHDHKINFRTRTVKFYIRLRFPDGHNPETFEQKLRLSPIWHLTSWADKSRTSDPEDTVRLKR